MSVDILGTSWNQCRSMVQYSFTSTETGRPPRLSHSSWTMMTWGWGEGVCYRVGGWLGVCFLKVSFFVWGVGGGGILVLYQLCSTFFKHYVFGCFLCWMCFFVLLAMYGFSECTCSCCGTFCLLSALACWVLFHRQRFVLLFRSYALCEWCKNSFLRQLLWNLFV